MNPVWTDLSRDWYEYEPAIIVVHWIEWILKKQPQILHCVQDDSVVGLLTVRDDGEFEAEIVKLTPA